MFAQVPTTTSTPPDPVNEALREIAARPWMPIVLVVGTVLVAYALVHVYRRHAGRERAVAAVARAHGMRFAPVDGSGLANVRFAAFSGGDGVDIGNVVVGHAPDGVPVRVFDYSVWSEYVVDDGSDTGRWRGGSGVDAVGPRLRRVTDGAVGTAAAIRVSAFLPRLQVRPESLVTRGLDTVGARDLQLESDEFNRTYDVRTADRQFAQLFLDAGMMSVLLDAEGHVALEVFGSWMLVTTDRAAPGDFPTLLNFAVAVRDAVPDLVVRMYPDATDAATRPGFRVGG